MAFLDLADLSAPATPLVEKKEHEDKGARERKAGGKDESAEPVVPFAGLRYNIEVHLPATKDVEVYNAIFKSLKEHLLED